MLNDTICAISTALKDGAISIVRMSGSDSFSIVRKINKRNGIYILLCLLLLPLASNVVKLSIPNEEISINMSYQAIMLVVFATHIFEDFKYETKKQKERILSLQRELYKKH